MPTPTPAIPTFTNGAVPVAANLNALGSNLTNLYNYTMAGSRTYKPVAVIRIVNVAGSGQNSLSNATYTPLQFDTADVNTDGMFDLFITNALGFVGLTVRTSGIYRLYVQWSMGPFVIASSYAEAHICVNGTTPSTYSVAGHVVTGRDGNAAVELGLTAGATIYAVAQQNIGSPQGMNVQYGGSYLIAEWISN